MALLLDRAAVVETRWLRDDPSLLLGVERKVLSDRAVGRRRQEFVSGRDCAHRALEKLTGTVTPIGQGPNRKPIWPSGVVGSITHTRNYAAAAVASASEVLSVGIDAEPNATLPEGVLEQIIGEGDLEALEVLRAELATRVNDEWAVELSIAALYEAATIRSMAELVLVAQFEEMDPAQASVLLSDFETEQQSRE